MAINSMTRGSIPGQLLRFSLPMVLGNLFQLTYNAVDTIVVGRWVGKNAVAAVGTANPIMNVVIFFIGGICMGALVLMAEYYGAEDLRRLKREISTTLLAGGLFALAMSVLCFFLARPVLLLIHTPPEILDDAAGYLRVIFAGLLFTYLYNFYSNTLRSIGDSRTPLLFLILSSLLNIGLDIAFVAGLKMGVRGAAVATVISQAVSGLLCILYIRIRIPLLRFGRGELVLDVSMLTRTVSYSWVTALQQTCIYVGKLAVQGAVNPLGVDSIAAFNAVARVDDFAITPMQSIGSALTTFTAQNHGARSEQRIHRGLACGALLGTGYWALICAPVFFGAGAVMHLFVPTGGQDVLALGMLYLHRMAFFYLLPAWTNTLQGYFRGRGLLVTTLVSSLLQIGIRVICSYALAPTSGIGGIAWACGIGWTAMVLYELSLYLRDRRRRLRPESAGAPPAGEK